jgi:hypothetical protein
VIAVHWNILLTFTLFFLFLTVIDDLQDDNQRASVNPIKRKNIYVEGGEGQ